MFFMVREEKNPPTKQIIQLSVFKTGDCYTGNQEKECLWEAREEDESKVETLPVIWKISKFKAVVSKQFNTSLKFKNIYNHQAWSRRNIINNKKKSDFSKFAQNTIHFLSNILTSFLKKCNHRKWFSVKFY